MLPIFSIQRLRYLRKVNIIQAQCVTAGEIKDTHCLNRTYVSKAQKPSILKMGIAMSSTSSAPTIKVPVAYYDEIKNLPNHRETLLVDVREPIEIQKTGRIPTSINVPLGSVQKAFSKEMSDEQFAKSYNHTKPQFKDEIIMSCQSGKRAEIAAETLVNLGYKQVKNYKGSWLEWAEKNGLPK